MIEDGLRKRLGQAIKRRRAAEGISQEELADRAGVHRTYMGSVERGERNVSLDNVERIARALDLPVWQLLKDAEGGEPAR